MLRKPLYLVTDMYGCPDRCRHCWLGHMPDRTMEPGADVWLVDYSNAFDIYFNFTHMTTGWKIGNLKTDPREEIIRRITLGELAARYGDPVSGKAFCLEDYQSDLLNRYVEDQLG